MKIITFYADCQLPELARKKQEGFDWRQAIELLAKSAKRFGYQTLVVTDQKTDIDAWLRVGDAKEEGLMLWLLNAQCEAIRSAESKSVMVSPDTLIAGDLRFLFGQSDVSILTRKKPKPIVNSVIGFLPSDRLYNLWTRIHERAKTLSDESREWGADIDAVVEVMGIQSDENRIRHVGDVRARFIPLYGNFESVRPYNEPKRLKAPIWDFKGSRKRLMPEYARFLC